MRSKREIGDGESPIFFYEHIQMDKGSIINAIASTVESRGCFIVDVTLTKDNDITVTLEKSVGTMDLDDCVAVNDVVLAAFDRDVEDYSLTVTSAGLDQPFKVPGQYTKAIGSQVDVAFKGGRKVTGLLTAADGDGIVLAYSQKELVEGKKKKVTVEHEDRFSFEEINSVVPHIVFSK